MDVKDFFNYAEKLTNSCKNPEQLDTAIRYLFALARKNKLNDFVFEFLEYLYSKESSRFEG